MHKKSEKASLHGRAFRTWLWIPACAGILGLGLPAHAADPLPVTPAPAAVATATTAKTETTDKPANPALPYTYASPGCDFKVDLPSAPLNARRCDADNASHCNDVTTFTHVFALDATVDFTITCTKAEPGMYDHYSGDVMRSALGGMVGKGKLDNFQTSFKQYDVAKQATIIGTGKQGVSDKLYIAQLWIGHQSVFSVEGEMIGQNNNDANDMFAGILKSIRYKDWKLAAPVAPVVQAAPVPVSSAAATAPSPAVAPPAEPAMIQMGEPTSSPAFAPASTTLIITPVDPATGKPVAPEK